MKIVIVGGGTVGYYLAKALLEHNHEPTVVESKKDVCSRLANNLDIPVILGDGTTIEALQEAGAAVRRTIAKANNPKNADVMWNWGWTSPFPASTPLPGSWNGKWICPASST